MTETTPLPAATVTCCTSACETSAVPHQSVVDPVYDFRALEVMDFSGGLYAVDQLLSWVLEEVGSDWEADELLVERLGADDGFVLRSDIDRLDELYVRRENLIFSAAAFREYLQELDSGSRTRGLRRLHSTAFAELLLIPADAYAEVDRLLEEPPPLIHMRFFHDWGR